MNQTSSYVSQVGDKRRYVGFAGEQFLISQFEQIAMQNAVHGTYTFKRKTELKVVHVQLSGWILLNKCQNK